MADGCHIEYPFFGHNSAADCPISVKFRVGKREFQQWDRYPCSRENISSVPRQFSVRRAGRGLLASSPIHFLVLTQHQRVTDGRMTLG